MVFCPHCGARMDDTSGTCPSCQGGVMPPPGPLAMPQAKGFFGALFDFSMKEVITPSIIRILYVIGVAGAALTSLIFLITSFISGEALGIIGGLILAPIFFIIGVIFLRIYMELVMVFFNILVELRDLKNR